MTKYRSTYSKLLSIWLLLGLSSTVVGAEDLTLTNESFMPYFKEDAANAGNFSVKEYDKITFNSVFDQGAHSGENVNEWIGINSRITKEHDDKTYTVEAKDIYYDNDWYRHTAIALQSTKNVVLTITAENKIEMKGDITYDYGGLISGDSCINSKVNIFAKEVLLEIEKRKDEYTFSGANHNIFGVTGNPNDVTFDVKAKDKIKLVGNMGAGIVQDFYAGSVFLGENVNIAINKDTENNPIVEIDGNIDTYNFNYDGKDYRNKGIYVRLNTKESYFKGAVKDYRKKLTVDLSKDEGTTLELANGATWYVTDKSQIRNINLEKKGTVKFLHEEDDFSSIKVDDLYGSEGILELNIDASRNDQSDYVVIRKEHKGTHYLKLNNVGANAEGALGSQLIFVVKESGEFKALDNDANIFFEKYTLKEEKIENDKWNSIWYLDKAEVTDTVTPIVKVIQDSLDKKYEALRDTDTLYRRLGRIDSHEINQKRVWMRHRDEAVSGREIGISWNDHQAIGVTYGAKQAINVYSTYVLKNGMYIDNAIGINRHKTQLQVGDKTADTTNYGIKVSSEVGIQKQLPNGVYVIPQGQVTYMHIMDNSYTTSNDIEIKESGMNSLLVRLGVHVGKSVQDTFDIYGRVDILSELLGNQTVDLHKENQYMTINNKHKKTWLSYGLGVTYRANDMLSFYGEVANGRHFSVGLNYLW